ncbi:hypothetical protein LSCM4_05887 [Leishmania orientalis]|uniref:Uncharacterized protein n=1 Tax=Leishmania orientalis TaxID=2249476 RepID=A0A836GTK7_9TRYP|nr:hypothetical protein LSCM4_05887 [Leishmania orientalis]
MVIIEGAVATRTPNCAKVERVARSHPPSPRTQELAHHTTFRSASTLRREVPCSTAMGSGAVLIFESAVPRAL